MRGRIIVWVTPLAAAMAMGGCGSMEIGGPIDARAAYPDFGSGSGSHASLGFLAVRRLQEPLEGGQGPSSTVPPGYRVYDDRGILVRSSAAGEVSLPEGRYLVQLERPGRGPHAFWVRIDQGKLTEVDFNRMAEPPQPTAPVE